MAEGGESATTSSPYEHLKAFAQRLKSALRDAEQASRDVLGGTIPVSPQGEVAWFWYIKAVKDTLEGAETVLGSFTRLPFVVSQTVPETKVAPAEGREEPIHGKFRPDPPADKSTGWGRTDELRAKVLTAQEVLADLRRAFDTFAAAKPQHRIGPQADRDTEIIRCMRYNILSGIESFLKSLRSHAELGGELVRLFPSR